MSIRAGISLTKEFESCRLTAYQDSVGVWTIGWGTTGNVYPGQTITQEVADRLLIERYDQAESQVKSVVKVPLTENQLGALTDFVYNVGFGNFKSSTLLRKLNAKDSSVILEFPRWNMAGGKVLAGLTRRRAAEVSLFNKKD